MSPTQEMVEASAVKAEIVAYMGDVMEQARQIAEAVKDDASADAAAELGVQIKTKVAWLKAKRTEIYEPLYKATERLRLEYDDPIKLGAQLEKTLSAKIIDYKLAKKREEERLRLAAEAEARRIREEAARKEREAEAERQRIIKEQEDRERKRREEEAAEERRKLAEAKAREDMEKARLQREQDERARRIKEEEDARLVKAQEAHDVGMPERVEGILEKPTAIAAVATLKSKVELDAEAERARLAREQEEGAERKRQEQLAEEQRLRDEESARMARLNEETARARAEADLAESQAAARASVTTADTRMRTNTSAKYEIPDAPSFLKLARAVAEGRAPIEFLGFDPEHPEKFRAPAIGRHATKIKGDPDFAGKQAELAAIGVRCWLEEGGSFKAEKTGVQELE